LKSEGRIVKIALASQNKKSITGHTGHCQNFWMYESNGTEIIDKKLLELSAEHSFHNSHADAPHPLDDVQVLICGGMGKNLQHRLEKRGIEAVITKETDVEKAVAAYLDGSLVREEAECHEHEHEEGHQHRHQHRHQHHPQPQV
jgi:predicted Fe-Mo cluster-binding NifX family protein